MKIMKNERTLLLYFGILASVLLVVARVAAAEDTQDLTPPEKRFQAAMTEATFVGRWFLVHEESLGEPRDEEYRIQGVTKLRGNQWVIQARIRYGEYDLTVPVPVHVHWADDTPVISVTNFTLPGAGTYSARVLIHQNTYAGTWSGGDHGGVLSGAIWHTPPDR